MAKIFLFLSLFISGTTAFAESNKTYAALLSANIVAIEGEYEGTVSSAADNQPVNVRLSLYRTSILTPMMNLVEVLEIPSVFGYLKTESGTTMLVFTKALIHPETYHLQMWGYSNATNYQAVNLFDVTYDGNTLKGKLFTPTYVSNIELKKAQLK